MWTAPVAQPASKAYKISFGMGIRSPVTQNFSIAISNIRNLPTDTTQGVVIRAKGDETENAFVIEKPGTGYELAFDYTLNGNSITQNDKDPVNGWYVISSRSDIPSIPNALTLDQKQLFGQDITEYAGSYTGGSSIFFCAALAVIAAGIAVAAALNDLSRPGHSTM